MRYALIKSVEIEKCIHTSIDAVSDVQKCQQLSTAYGSCYCNENLNEEAHLFENGISTIE